MDLLLFSGNSPKHEKWIEEVEDTLKPLFTKTYIQYYQHWKSEEEVILLDHELSEVEKIIGQFKNYFIFAKSAGTLLALKGIYEGVLNPQRCVFVGLPVPWAQEHNFKINRWINKFSVPTLFIQKRYDPIFHYDELNLYLKKEKVEDFESVELEGSSHDYDDLKLLKELVKEFTPQT